MKPHIISTDTSDIADPPLYSPQSLEQLDYILLNTVEEGTAVKARIPGCTVKGKTGSANLLVNGSYDPHKSIFTFAGIVEHKDYKRVIVVCIKAPEKHGIYSSQVAVPLFKTVAEAMLLHDGIIISL